MKSSRPPAYVRCELHKDRRVAPLGQECCACQRVFKKAPTKKQIKLWEMFPRIFNNEGGNHEDVRV